MSSRFSKYFIFFGILIISVISAYRGSARVPTYGKVFHKLGLQCMDQCTPEKSFGYFQKAIYHDPGMADSYYQMGVLYGKQGDREKEIQYYKKTVERDPARFKVYLKIVDYHFQREEFEYIAKYVRQTYNVDSDKMKIYINFAQHFDMRSMYPEAAFWYMILVMYGSTYSEEAEARIRGLIFRVPGLKDSVIKQVESLKKYNYLENNELRRKIDEILTTEYHLKSMSK